MYIKVAIATKIAKLLVKPQSSHDQHSGQDNYRHWRESLKREYVSSFVVDLVHNAKDIDFGCGTGEMSYLLCKFGASSVVGIDLTARDVKIATSRLKDEPIEFVVSSSSDRIDLADESVDVIVCFDVMEHIMEYEAIMREWQRVLRPGGRVLIHWQPWLHDPYGHHGHVYGLLPWAHVFLTHREQVEVCANVIDCPTVSAPWWDQANGKRVNRFRDSLEAGTADKSDFLNQLTTARFERLIKGVGLRIERVTYEHFSGPLLIRKVSALLTKIYLLREFFMANAVYVLTKG